MLGWMGVGRKSAAGLLAALLKTGQTTQYSSELDDGYYEIGVAKSYTVNTTGAQSGTSNVDVPHILASIAISFDAASKEIRGTGLMGVFKASGGETIVISGSVNNNGVFTTKATGTADKVIVNETVVNESAGAAVTISTREAISNNTVLDNNTGRTWTRYHPTKLGSAGDQRMVWTGVPYDIFAYCAAANLASLGGYTDWRVPTFFELLSLWDGEAPSGVPDSTAFPTWVANYYWSSTTTPNNTASAQVFRFADGAASNGTKTAGLYISMLVRGG